MIHFFHYKENNLKFIVFNAHTHYRVYIGAPRANSTEKYRKFQEIGVVYKCEIHNATCKIFDIDQSGNGQDQDNPSFKENKMSSWLGASMDGDDNGDDLVVIFR